MRQAGDFLRTGIEQLRHARPLDDGNAGQEVLQDRPHRCSPQKQRLATPPQMQDPVGEDVTALEIAGKLHFVDRHEGRGRLARHRFDGADRIAGAMRSDLLLASDQRDIVMADPFDQARIDLARQEAQRQAYDAAIMRDHALDRVVRLAGIGWPEHRGYAAAAQDHGVNGHVIDPGHSET
ncbi:hypothetical protein D9M72_468510 [compost metagenome]